MIPYGDLEEKLSLELVRVVEAAALSAARTMGQGDRKGSDHAAVEAMRDAFQDLPIDGTIVIGEGERDEAPMLYIGERVGPEAPAGIRFPKVDIAVDPLEGTNLCATGAAASIAVLAASEPGSKLLPLLAGWFREQRASKICVNVDPANAAATQFYTRHGAERLNEHWLVWHDISSVLGRA